MEFRRVEISILQFTEFGAIERCFGTAKQLNSLIYPLRTIRNHFFLEKSERLLLLDTGAPQSFCMEPDLELAGLTFQVPENYLGLNSDQLSDFVSVDCHGLLGTDVLGNFDIIFDQPGSRIRITEEMQETEEGEIIHFKDFLGIPIIEVLIDGAGYQMFLDTGAQISYLQHDSFFDYQIVGHMEDFYPGYGRFETELRKVTAKVGANSYGLKFGTLPNILATALTPVGVQGILGNEIFMQRITGYYPRTGKLYLNMPA